MKETNNRILVEQFVTVSFLASEVMHYLELKTNTKARPLKIMIIGEFLIFVELGAVRRTVGPSDGLNFKFQKFKKSELESSIRF